MPPLKSFEVGHLRVLIEQDCDPQSPAEWDNVGEIVYASDHYTLGTRRVSRSGLNEIAVGIESGELIGMPVFAYVHGSAMIHAAESNPFNCPWDSGQSGFVFCTYERAIQEFPGQAEKVVRREVLRTMVAEVETFSQYLQGDVYGYRIMDGDNEVESCWGLYGLDYAVKEAKAVAEALCHA
jgi:hypothetical protein